MHQSTRGKRRNSNKMQKFRRRNLRLNWLKQPQVTWTGGGNGVPAARGTWLRYALTNTESIAKTASFSEKEKENGGDSKFWRIKFSRLLQPSFEQLNLCEGPEFWSTVRIIIFFVSFPSFAHCLFIYFVKNIFLRWLDYIKIIIITKITRYNYILKFFILKF